MQQSPGPTVFVTTRSEKSQKPVSELRKHIVSIPSKPPFQSITLRQTYLKDTFIWIETGTSVESRIGLPCNIQNYKSIPPWPSSYHMAQSRSILKPLQNGHTGIDLSVPEYQEIRGKMMSGHVEYNILVVTQLAVFKSAKHKPEDNVQFMVSKKYSDIDEFYQKLVTRYPQTSLPPLPRKVLFVGESDIRERRAAFSEIMGLISKNVALASSPELLEFLGTRSTSVIDVKSKNLPKKEEEDDETEGFDFFKEEKIPDVISQFSSFKSQEAKKETEEEESDMDPLGVLKSKKPKKPTFSPAQEDKTKLTIFHGEVDPGELFGTSEDFSSPSNRKILAVKEDVKLFEGPDLGGVVTLGDPLLLMTASEDREPLLHVSPAEDVEELLRVEDDFEKMLQVSSKPKLKPKPNVASKPAIPRKPVIPEKKSSSSPTQTGQPAEEKIQSMDEMDILKYIKENESLSGAEPSLF